MSKKGFRTSIGGQALLEGVMMRGPKKYAAVVRTPEGLISKEEPAPYPKEKNRILGWVFIRGVCNFVQSMAIGMKTLFWSADQVAASDGECPAESDTTDQSEARSREKAQPSGIGKGLFAVTMVIALVLVVGLFTVLPTFIGGLLSPWIGEQSFARNAAETGMRLVILLTYMILVSLTKDIQRTFAYHGAEHKAIAAYEAGDELTVENVRLRSRFHPRCGTSFLLTVVLVSMIAFLLISLPLQRLEFGSKMGNIFIRTGLRLSLLPFVVAISYEINRLVGRTDSILSKIVRSPGIAMQRITTREPTDDMIEVAVDALQRVIPEEEGTDKWGTE
ncbi:MAG: DUF1385 domain-containing protein [Oscillospiraceae bacterium]|nr:DUF1385 domain-containing protein [Oscillospiraceae bacterium]